MITKQKRPKFLNLLRIHLPVTGVNSFAHRVSGFLLFLSIPVLIAAFNLSLRDQAGFDKLILCVQSGIFKLVLSILAWAIAHHLLAGIRFLLAELDLGTSLKASRTLAWVVNISGIILFIFAIYRIWL